MSKLSHTMNSYFSSTDMDELKDNAGNHNIYVSIIVNNYGKIVAKAATVAEYTEEIKSYGTYKSFKGEDVSITFEEEKTTKKVLFIRDCEIASDKKIIVDQPFQSRYDDLVKQKEAKKVRTFHSGRQTSAFDWKDWENGGSGRVNYNSHPTSSSDKKASASDFLEMLALSGGEPTGNLRNTLEKVELQLLDVPSELINQYSEELDKKLEECYNRVHGRIATASIGSEKKYVEFLWEAIMELNACWDLVTVCNCLYQVIESELELMDA